MSSVGLFGKTPSQRDFVRVNIGGALVTAFDEWLRASVMALPGLRAHLPPETLPFLFRAPQGDEVLIGVMRGSQDGVGREFPLAVFQRVDGSSHALDWPGLPQAYAEFLAAAEALLDRVDGSDASQLAAMLDSLPLPTAASVREAHLAGWQRLAESTADELLDRLFSRPTGNPEGDRWPLDHAYGIGLLLQGCYRVGGQPPRSGEGVCLDCPVTSDAELMFWLELTRRVLHWPSPPCFMWSQRQYRLLLVLGTPSAKLLGLLGTPGTFDDRVWPLVPDDEDQAARGPQLLTPQQFAALDHPGQSGAALIEGIAPAR